MKDMLTMVFAYVVELVMMLGVSWLILSLINKVFHGGMGWKWYMGIGMFDAIMLVFIFIINF